LGSRPGLPEYDIWQARNKDGTFLRMKHKKEIVKTELRRRIRDARQSGKMLSEPLRGLSTFELAPKSLPIPGSINSGNLPAGSGNISDL
jgi:hypothetical protein